MIGQTIREFEILSELGAGGYGAVYRAHDTSVDRDVAIKVILPQYAENPDFKQRFESEAKTVAQLESRQIVPLYTYWQDEQGAFLVMRLIRGGSLRRIMMKQGAMSLSQAIRILSDIAEALSVAHENDVVHRDLKPENILIDERGNAYLTDFGIAKRTTEAENITEADAIVGTWAYLSPEQVQNIDVSAQSDIYAFGILLYEMLVGKHPFHGIPATMMIMKHLQENLPDIYDERPDLPHELDDIIQKATAKDPSERYESTLELITDLKIVAKESNQSLAPIKTVQRKKASSPEERNRQAMLENVRKFWIEGVLENSSQNSVLLNLGKRDASEQINNPWETVIRTTNTNDKIMSADATTFNIFEQMNGKLLILGEPGGGKTTMMLELARDLLSQAEYDNEHPIPVVFNLSSWALKQDTLENWLVSELSDKYQVPKKVSSKWVENDELILLLDGLDEVQADVRDACVTAINTYRTEHGFVDMVVCSRTHDYKDLSDKLLLNGAIVIQALTEEQIQLYLQQFGASAEMANQLIASDSELAELAKSPLMLNIIVQAYQNVSAETLPKATTIEDRRQQLFKLYVSNTLKQRPTATYDSEQVYLFLGKIARAMQRKSMTIFQIENLEQDWFLNKQQSQQADVIVLTSLIFAFVIPYLLAALSMGAAITIFWGWLLLIFLMEWVILFTGVGIGQYRKVNHLYFALGSGIIISLLILFPLYTMLTPIQSILIIGATILYGFMSYMLKIKFANFLMPFEYRPTMYQIKRVEMDWRIAVAGALQAISIITLLIISTVPTASGLTISISILIGFILFGGIYYVLSGLRPKQDDTFYNYPQLRLAFASNAFKFGILGFVPTISILFAIGLVLGMSIMNTLAFGFGFGILIGIKLWTFTGGINLLLLSVVFPLFAHWGHLPSDPYAFLDYARQSVLMRRVGKGYIFIHRYLLEYFADLETNTK